MQNTATTHNIVYRIWLKVHYSTQQLRTQKPDKWSRIISIKVTLFTFVHWLNFDSEANVWLHASGETMWFLCSVPELDWIGVRLNNKWQLLCGSATARISRGKNSSRQAPLVYQWYNITSNVRLYQPNPPHEHSRYRRVTLYPIFHLAINILW